MQGLEAIKMITLFTFEVPAHCITYAQPFYESNPVTADRELSVLTTRPPSLQHCRDEMSYLNQMYEKKAIQVTRQCGCLRDFCMTSFYSKKRVIFKALAAGTKVRRTN